MNKNNVNDMELINTNEKYSSTSEVKHSYCYFIYLREIVAIIYSRGPSTEGTLRPKPKPWAYLRKCVSRRTTALPLKKPQRKAIAAGVTQGLYH